MKRLFVFVVLVFVPLSAVSPIDGERVADSREAGEIREQMPSRVGEVREVETEVPRWLNLGRRGLQSVVSHFGLPGGIPALPIC